MSASVELRYPVIPRGVVSILGSRVTWPLFYSRPLVYLPRAHLPNLYTTHLEVKPRCLPRRLNDGFTHTTYQVSRSRLTRGNSGTQSMSTSQKYSPTSEPVITWMLKSFINLLTEHPELLKDRASNFTIFTLLQYPGAGLFP